jgi:hypothetical protein
VKQAASKLNLNTHCESGDAVDHWVWKKRMNGIAIATCQAISVLLTKK